MSAPKFTAAPWRLQEFGDLGHINVRASCRNGATVLGRVNGGDEEGVANAKLIAAAPDLYDAVKGLLSYGQLLRLVDPGVAASVDSDPAWTKAREAIARAHEGEFECPV